MAWNESGNGKNPWDRGRGQGGPPDLDKIVREWQQRISALFGGRRRTDGPGNSSMFLVLLVVIAIGWAATGFYRVDESVRGVVLRFGQFQVPATMPGLRWHLPWPIEQVEKVNITAVNRFSRTTRMLTADENIVVVDMVVQYRNADPTAFLFNVREPELVLGNVSESAIREVIGQSQMDYILGAGRAEIAINTAAVIQEALDYYEIGIVVTKVNLQDVNFPSQVEAAVQDAIKAREDEVRLGFEAQTYANDILPRARGEAVRRIQDAEAYREGVIANAQGEAARFEKLLVEYQKAPEVTRERLYIEAIEDVYAEANKVLMDASGSGNLLYLPVDKIIEAQQQRRSSGPASGNTAGVSGSADTAAGSRAARDDQRRRGTR
ncbi:MAG: FtsH protease activity modulator HflK [Gammaproteobacteria bacterium]|jgi:membrane protease subunit HflK